AHVVHALAGHLEDDVLDSEAAARRRAALDDLHDLDAGGAPELGGEPGRERSGTAADAEEGPTVPTIGHERGDDAPRGVVDPDGRTRSTARSASGSVPTTSKSNSRPSTNAALPPSEPCTTCADVRRKPSGVMAMADPAPSPRRPPDTRRTTRTLATDGSNRSA